MLDDLTRADPWSNWVGNQSFTQMYTAAPADEQELSALVRDASERGLGVRVAAQRLHALYPEADEFIKLRQELDREGMFLNDHLRELFL